MRNLRIGFIIISLGILIFGIYQLLIYVYVLTPWTISWIDEIIVSSPAKPEITYGEFPICITYEVNGTVEVLKDTVICEYDGIESRGAAGKYRKWKSYLKSGNDSLAFFPIEKNVTIEVGIFRGFPSYYMGDYSERNKEDYERGMLYEKYEEYIEYRNGIKTGRSYTQEEVWEKYRFKIIGVNYSPPIHNHFQ